MTVIRSLLVCAALAAQPVTAAMAQVATPRDAVDVMIQAVANRDADAVAALYAETSVVMSPGAAPLTSRTAIRDAWAGNFQNGYARLEVAEPRVERGSDRAAMVFHWRATIQPPGQTEGRYILGRSMLYFIRSEDGWLISADMWHPPEGS